MTETEAKEIVISAMNFIAYSDVGPSLFCADKNWLFGSEHYGMEPNTVHSDKPSPWRIAGELHHKLPDFQVRFSEIRR